MSFEGNKREIRQRFFAFLANLFVHLESGSKVKSEISRKIAQFCTSNWNNTFTGGFVKSFCEDLG